MRFSCGSTKFASVLLLVFVVLFAASVQAQTGKSPSEIAKQRARTSYSRGQELFEAGEYEKAQTAFEEAYHEVPNPIVLLSIAESQKQLGQVADAVATLERYLALKKDAPDRASVEEKIEEMRSLKAILAISSDPEGATIRIDGTETGKLTPAEISLDPGQHVIVLTTSDGQKVSELVEVSFGTRHELVIEFEDLSFQDPFTKQSAGMDEVTQTSPVEELPRESSLALPIVLTSVGGAALITGGVLGAITLSKKNKYEDKPTAKRADNVERYGLFTDVAFGVGALAVITGLVLFFTMGDDTPDFPDTEASKGVDARSDIEVLPLVTGEHVLMSARVIF